MARATLSVISFSAASFGMTTPSYDCRAPETPSSTALEDFVTGCSPGCTLTAEEVEENLAVSYPVVPGSLRFDTVATPRRARFTVNLDGGGSILGVVEVKLVVEDRQVTAYSDIQVLGVQGSAVPVGPGQRQVDTGLGRGSVRYDRRSSLAGV